MFAINLYSASAEDRATTDYFLHLQEIKEDPRKAYNPLVNLLESRQVAQSTYTNALS